MNPVQYTSRTYLTALADFNADPLLADKPFWIKSLFAGTIDVASTWENASANNNFLRTLKTRRAAIDVAGLIDYNPTPKVTASGTMMFDAAPGAAMPFTVVKANLAGNGPSGLGASALRYQARASLLFATLTEVIAAASFVVATSLITVASVFTSGEKLRFTTSNTLPAGISLATDYFAIYVSPTTIRIATTRALALLGAFVAFTDQGVGNHTATRLSRAIAAYQQNDVLAYDAGSSDGSTAFQEFDIPQVGVLVDTIAVTINALAYTKMTTLALSAPTDRVFRVYYNTDGTCTLRFGNGVYGNIPPAATVFVDYSYGGGALSNVTYANQIVSYAGGDANLNGCFNVTAMTGGAEEESIDSVRVNAPLLLKARSRFITTLDGEALALAYGGLNVVKINRNVYGILSVQVVGIASGGGNPSAPTRTAIAAYLQALTPIEDIFVQFDACTLTPVTAALDVHLYSGYSWATTSAYVITAASLFFSETGAEVLAAYVAGGVSAAVTKINTLFATTYTAVDYPAITAILNMFTILGARAFGDLIQEADLSAILAVVPGVDYTILTASVPALPKTCTASEITTMTGGSITPTQV